MIKNKNENGYKIILRRLYHMASMKTDCLMYVRVEQKKKIQLFSEWYLFLFYFKFFPPLLNI